MRAAIWTVVINVILIAVLVTPMWKMGLPFAHAGIAAATAIAGTFNAALLWRWLRRDGTYQPEPGWGRWLLRLAIALLLGHVAQVGHHLVAQLVDVFDLGLGDEVAAGVLPVAGGDGAWGCHGKAPLSECVCGQQRKPRLA